MDAKELKFLLKLLGCENYRAPLSQIKPTPSMKAEERDSICRKLWGRELVEGNEEIKKFTITSTGKALLKLDPAELPMSDSERKVLQAAAKGTVTPTKTGMTGEEAQPIIKTLIEKGFIKPVERKITEVWITNRGKEFLRDEFESSSTAANINFKMLTDYLRFMRKHRGGQVVTETPQPIDKPSDEEILQLIKYLDHELGTDNYLPIFHLRQKLQPPLSRDELDQALYRLSREDKIDFSSLVDPTPYTAQQVEAGIPKKVGGRLFFLVVN